MSSTAAYRDFDYERRFGDVKRLEKAVTHFSQAVGRGMIAMKEIASSFEAVGGVLAEMTSANSVATQYMESKVLSPENRSSSTEQHAFAATPSTTSPAAACLPGWDSVSMLGASVAPGSHIDDDAAAQMHRLTVLFAEEARRLNEGQPFLLYNTGVHRDVVNRLLPIVEHLKAADAVAKKRDEALAKYQKYKSLVEKREQHYAKKGKAFVDHDGYKKAAEKRDEAWKAYAAARGKFYDAYRLLMEVHGHAVAHIVHRYLTLNGGYLRELLSAIESVLPTMEQIYPTNIEFGSQAPSILSAVALLNHNAPGATAPGKEGNSAEKEPHVSGAIAEEGKNGDVQRLNSGGLDAYDMKQWEQLPELQSDGEKAKSLPTPLPGAVEEAGGVVEEEVGDSHRESGVFASVATASAKRANSQSQEVAMGAHDVKGLDEIVTRSTLDSIRLPREHVPASELGPRGSEYEGGSGQKKGNTVYKDPHA
ncbi:uncharacterized protein Tco025E_09906 [Trypanosoma conorhini]|uniref:BAR domain-containing protein n=1 Tax=Trypanosoma conorhini TaxID=83891 RepID=A0A3R7JRR2_9TRYP|nr:uncharacterized protein Tco025E_09906 [Trypanosoma conorhini]RNE95826.1 hypothetical protein Tco025E_09906 [Trypanosoma conorhini]